MNITFTEQDGVLTAAIDGRLDSVTSPEFGQKIAPVIEHADKKIVLDCKDMSYISSAGLRQFLVIRKATLAKGGSVTLLNLRDDVRQVFALTGFLELFGL